MTQKNLPLGKGLAALLGDLKLSTPDSSSANSPQITMLNLDQLVAGHFQPRQFFNEQAIDELALSIQKHGLIQPISVRPKGEHYEIIAGERRWRACQKIALSPIPVIVQNVSDENALAIALIENLQRQELNALEEAQALHRLIEEFSLSHQQIAEVLGQSRSHISNQLRLLQLEPEVQHLLAQGLISSGHARCLIGLETNTQIQIAEKIQQQQWSVRVTEKYIQQLNQPNTKKSPKNQNVERHQQLIKELEKAWATPFKIQAQSHQQGKIIINYKNEQDFEHLLQHLLNKNKVLAD
jgi:ParB family chromosome partitioning protein